MPAICTLITHHLPLITSAAWIPFVTPAPLWNAWWFLAIPLVAAIAIVYKSVKCRRMKRVAIEAAQLSGYLLVAMILGAAALTILVDVVLG